MVVIETPYDLCISQRAHASSGSPFKFTFIEYRRVCFYNVRARFRNWLNSPRFCLPILSSLRTVPIIIQLSFYFHGLIVRIIDIRAGERENAGIHRVESIFHEPGIKRLSFPCISYISTYFPFVYTCLRRVRKTFALKC